MPPFFRTLLRVPAFLARAWHAPTEDTAQQDVLRAYQRRLHPPAPPADVAVDWDQSPPGYPIWKHDVEKGVSVWMSGRSRVEEYGQVWDALPAPSFGATVTCRATLTVEEQGALEARRRARRLQRGLEAAACSPPRPRL